jgi:hypothetical protein
LAAVTQDCDSLIAQIFQVSVFVVEHLYHLLTPPLCRFSLFNV